MMVFDESGFLMNFFDEIDHFHPDFDESVPNPRLLQWRPVRHGMRGVRVGEALKPRPSGNPLCESDSGNTSGQFRD